MIGMYHNGAVPPLVTKFGVAADVYRRHWLEICPQCFGHRDLVMLVRLTHAQFPILLVRPSFELVGETGIVVTAEFVDAFAFDVLR